MELLRDGEEGGASGRRRARLDDLDLRLRLRLEEDRAAIDEALRALHADAIEAGDFGVARRVRFLIGCSASDRGEHAVAVRELERLVEKGVASPLREPDVFLSLGRSLSAGESGRPGGTGNIRRVKNVLDAADAQADWVELGVTHERVRQLETKALEELRLRAPQLGRYLHNDASLPPDGRRCNGM